MMTHRSVVAHLSRIRYLQGCAERSCPQKPSCTVNFVDVVTLTRTGYLFRAFTFRPAPTLILPPALPLSPVKIPGR